MRVTITSFLDLGMPATRKKTCFVWNALLCLTKQYLKSNWIIPAERTLSQYCKFHLCGVRLGLGLL